MDFEKYHFHLYFDNTEIDVLKRVLKKLEVFDKIEIGRIREYPVGPHPTGSCQITVQLGDFEKMLSWFLFERDGLDIFIHALSGDDLKDHTDYTLWVGQQHELNLDFFRPSLKCV